MLTFNENDFEKNENQQVPDTSEQTDASVVEAAGEIPSEADLGEKTATKKSKKKKSTNKGSFKNSFKTRATKAGTYSFAVCVIALAAVIVINMIVGKLPSRFISVDTTKSQLYTLGDYTKKIVGNIDEDVTVYIIATAGNTDEKIDKLLSRYKDLNSHIKVEVKDPEISRISEEYTDSELSENSLIVVSDKRSKVVSYNSIYEYSEQMQSYAYQGANVSPDIFSGENAITSALNFVTTDVLPKVYTLTAHGESALSETILSSVSDENIEVSELDLLKAKSVPADCKCLIIYAPQTDMTADEKQMLLSYLEKGGRMFITTDSETKALPNFEAVFEAYGVEREDGIILEADEQYNYSSYIMLLPNMLSHEITDAITQSDYRVYIPYAQGIKETDSHRSTLTLASLLSTSDSAYAKVNVTESTAPEKADGDIEGPFSLGYAISEKNGDNETRIVWISSNAFLNDSFLTYGNLNLFLNSLKWMCELEENISVVESKNLSITNQLQITSGAGSIWNIVFIGIIPISSLIAGIAIWVRRKKR